MALDTQVVKNIAHLARIAIDERELPTYATALSTILDFVDQMSSVDTRGVTPMPTPGYEPETARRCSNRSRSTRTPPATCSKGGQRALPRSSGH